jgi:hypothetical protein
MESRKTLAYGVLLSKPGALSTELRQVKPPPSHHFFWIAGWANHFMYSRAMSFLSEYLTTEMPWPPSMANCLSPLGMGKKPVLSPPTCGSFEMPGKKAMNCICIATWPDL